MGRRSAVIVRVELPEALAAIRERLDPAARLGVPPHVTILHPFVPADELGPDDRVALGAIARVTAPFRARFATVEVVEGAVWLVPDDQQRLLELTDAIVDRYPGHLPYEGKHRREDLVAHLTLVEGAGADAHSVVTAADASLPFVAQVDRIEVIEEQDDGTWSSRWELPLGG